MQDMMFGCVADMSSPSPQDQPCGRGRVGGSTVHRLLPAQERTPNSGKFSRAVYWTHQGNDHEYIILCIIAHQPRVHHNPYKTYFYTCLLIHVVQIIAGVGFIIIVQEVTQNPHQCNALYECNNSLPMQKKQTPSLLIFLIILRKGHSRFND